MSRSSFSSGGRHSHATVFIGGGGHHRYGSGNVRPGMFIFMAIFFIVMGMIPVVLGINYIAERFKYDSVNAECVLNDKVSGWYYTTYKYEVDGKEYRNRSEEGWEFPEEVGKIVEIYYLKSNPNVITEKRPGSLGGIGLLLVGLIFVGAGGLLILGIKQSNKLKNGNENKSAYSQPKAESRCQYCGAKIGDDENSCSKCGASRID